MPTPSGRELGESPKKTLGPRVFSFMGDTALYGLLFWTPSVVLHALRGHKFSGIDVIVLTAGLPTFYGFCLPLIWRRRPRFKSLLQRVVPEVLGVWLFGPLMILISESFAGGGFAKPDAWQLLGLGTAFFPVFTFMMSTYDGTLGAVLLATLCLPVLALFVGPKRDGTGPAVARI